MTSKPPRRGYVLLMVLGLIGLAAIALSGLARYSLQLATDARIAAEEAQYRWGEISCRRMLLERAEEILAAHLVRDDDNEPQRGPRLPQLQSSFWLSDQQFTVLLADESAKVNLNALLRKRSAKVVECLREFVDERDAYVPRVQLRPQRVGSAIEASFESWGQVFDFRSMESADTIPVALLAATGEMTCWGDERLNVRRASDTALRMVGGLVLNAQEIGDLLTVRGNWEEDATLDELFRQLDLRRDKLVALRSLLTDESSCHSLWLFARTPQRSWSTLAIVGAGDRTGPKLRSYAW